jgi:hypothetical protein
MPLAKPRIGVVYIPGEELPWRVVVNDVAYMRGGSVYREWVERRAADWPDHFTPEAYPEEFELPAD